MGFYLSSLDLFSGSGALSDPATLRWVDLKAAKQSQTLMVMEDFPRTLWVVIRERGLGRLMWWLRIISAPCITVTHPPQVHMFSFMRIGTFFDTDLLNFTGIQDAYLRIMGTTMYPMLDPHYLRHTLRQLSKRKDERL